MGISTIISSSSYFNPAIQVSAGQLPYRQQAVNAYVPSVQSPQDTVHFSQLAQIQQMSQLGESAATIASTTGLTIGEVDSDLGITASSSNISIAPAGNGGGGSPAAPAASTSQSATSGSTLSVRA